MPNHPRLHLRGNVYYHRATVPDDIAATYPKTEETFSLRTSNFHEALVKLRQASAEVDRRFAEHRQREHQMQRFKSQPERDSLTPKELEYIYDCYLEHLIDEDDNLRYENGFFDEDEAIPATPKPSFEEYVEASAAYEAHSRKSFARGKPDNFILTEVDEVLSWDGIEIRLAASSPDRRKVALKLHEAEIQAAQIIKQRNEGNVVPTPRASSEATPSKGSNTPLLSDAIEEWMSESAASWKGNTEAKFRRSLRFFIEIAGDKPIANYTVNDGRTFKQTLLKLPVDWKRNASFVGMTKTEIAAAASTDSQKRSSKSTNDDLSNVATAFNWIIANYDEVSRNPCLGLSIKRTTKEKKTARKEWTIEDLNRFFRGPPYTGARSQRYFCIPGDLILDDSLIYWAPLLSLFSGMRSNEICQLEFRNIQQDTATGIWFIEATEEDEQSILAEKSLKGENSGRRVPIHQTLIDLGFLSFVERAKSHGWSRLFPETKPDKYGYHSSTLTRKIKNYKESLNINVAKTSFHSLRHNFTNTRRSLRLHTETIEAITGRQSSLPRDTYGDGFDLTALNSELQKAHFPGLDLTHLAPRTASVKKGP